MSLPESESHVLGEDEEGEEEEEEEEKEEEVEVMKEMRSLAQRMSEGPVSLRVHDVVIKGNAKTKESLIEAEVLDIFRSVSSMQDLVQAAEIANAKLQRLDIFESVSIMLDAGPSELPDTANVVIEVVEVKNLLSGDVGVFTRPGDSKAWTLELSLKLKNLFGFGDIWDASGVYGWNQTTELSTGISLPRFKSLSTPISARISLLKQDLLKLSSYKEHLMGLSVGLISTRYHDLAYNLTWRTLKDPSRMASKSIRRNLGHSLLSSLKYTFKFDRRDSHLRPTSGYAFMSTSQIGGIGDSKFLRFVRQEFDFRGAFPLGCCNTALNFGAAAGIIFPWGRGSMSSSSPISDRFHIGGQSSVVCGLEGPMSLLGFKLRGLGPTDTRRLLSKDPREEDRNSSQERDFLGGDFAVTSFADLSFDLPLKFLRESGIHGHTFVCAGNLVKLSNNEYKRFSFQDFFSSFRSSVGAGIVIPTKIFRVEINYCYILKQLQHDNAKTGIQFNFSSPS